MITSNQLVLIADTRKYSILCEQDLQGFVQSGQFVPLMDGPHALLTVDSVEASTVAICTQRHAGEPLALVDFVALAGA